MSELSYEELQASVKEMQGYIASLKQQYKANEEEEEDDHEASFKQAMDKMEKHEKEASRIADMVASFKQANDTEDPEERKAAMRMAMDKMDEYEKEKEAKKHKASDDEEDDGEKDASRIASLENEIKKPIIQKILTASATVNPKSLKRLESQLKVASLPAIKAKWAEIEPFANALGLAGGVPVTTPQQQGIPFQASAVTGGDTELHVASADEEFGKLDTEKLLQEMYR